MPHHNNATDPKEVPVSYVAAAMRDVEDAHRAQRKPYPSPPTGLDLERALTTKETGSILGQADITLQQWRARGKGPRFFRVGGGKRPAIRYRLGDVLAYRDAKMVGKAP